MPKGPKGKRRKDSDDEGASPPLPIEIKGKSNRKGKQPKDKAVSKGGSGFIDVDPRRVRFQYAKIRPVFSGCGRSVTDTLESIRSGQLEVKDLPPIQVLIGPPEENGERWYFSLNNRRLWVLKALREEGLLEGDTVRVRWRDFKSQAETERYTVANCSLDAKFVREGKIEPNEAEGEGNCAQSDAKVGMVVLDDAMEDGKQILCDKAHGGTSISPEELQRAQQRSKELPTTTDPTRVAAEDGMISITLTNVRDDESMVIDVQQSDCVGTVVRQAFSLGGPLAVWFPLRVRVGGNDIDLDCSFEENEIQDEARITMEIETPVSFGAIAATTNDYDGNVTTSRESLLQLSLDGTVACAVLWGGGSVHSTYDNATCRLEGVVECCDPTGSSYSLQGGFGNKVVGNSVDQHALLSLTGETLYSNGPREEWSGQLVPREDGQGMVLSNGRYTWYGSRQRTSSGKLDLELNVNTEFPEECTAAELEMRISNSV